MANLPAIGSGPLSVTDTNGAQHDIPLSLISFGANNVPVFSANVPAAVQTVALPLLNALIGQKIIVPAASPPPMPVFTITAVEAGALGNTISITFSNPVSTPANAVDVTVSATQVYQGLTPTTLGAVIGTTSGGGSMPGLAFLSSSGTPGMPSASATPFTLQGAVYEAAVPGISPAPSAFTLESFSTNADSVNLTATVSAVNTAASSFNLTIAWTKSAAAVPLADLTQLNSDFGFLLSFSPPPAGAPPSGTPYALPAAGTIVLQGGADPTPATPAAPATKATATAATA